MKALDKTHIVKTIFRGIPWLALFIAATAWAKTGNKPAERGAAHVEVQQDAGGFTITQRLRVPADVRSDYDAAVRLLEEAKYEPAITLLLKVTEQAPAATAAHID